MQPSFNDPFAEETIDLQKMVMRHLHLWPWFLLSIAMTLAAAWFYNAYQEKKYENNLTILIYDEEPILKLDDQIAAAFSNKSTKLQNESGVITSKQLIAKTLGSLDFTVEYHLKTTFITQELYPNSWFSIEYDSIWPQSVNVPIHISRLSTGDWKISGSWDNAFLHSFASAQTIGPEGKTEFQTLVKPGQWVEQPNLRFRIRENAGHIPNEDMEFVIFFRDPNTLLGQYSQIKVTEIPQSTMLLLSFSGSNTVKNATFLNRHADNFLKRELNKKTYRAQITIDFIEEQLALASQSLNLSENNLEDFRSTGQILNLDFQAQQSFTQLEQLQQQHTAMNVKEKYYQYLENYLDQAGTSGSDLIAPSSLGVDDPLLSGLIQELMKLYSERSEMMINSRRDNPITSNIEGRIQITKNTIRESLRSINQANKMAMTDLEERIGTLSSKISTIPESQRNLINIERQFNLHDNLYTFLKTKKSEIEITKAGFTPVHEIIDVARPQDGKLTSTKSRTTYYMALFAGLLLPVIAIFLFDFFNDKVRSSEEIEKITNYPVLGFISRNPGKNEKQKLVAFDKQSILAESFRSIRTNAQFVLPPNEVPVILFTSTILSEGKTFASLNLTAGYASMGKKCVLLSFDLRKPKLHKYLGTEQQTGLSNFLSSSIKPEEIITPGPVENMDIVYSGQIPPNPAELLSSHRMTELFTFLKSQYDVIIVDTPPVGMVADALLLLQHVNVVIYLVRHNTTPVKFLQHTLRNLKEKDVKNINIVLNDIPAPGRFNYYQAYGYQYGYFEEQKSV